MAVYCETCGAKMHFGAHDPTDRARCDLLRAEEKIAAAVAAERERCIRICMEMAEGRRRMAASNRLPTEHLSVGMQQILKEGADLFDALANQCEYLADEIRNREETPNG